ncbi:MAG TPA: hypothetical protein VL475_07080 [Planctomycetaceae bacterium]|nr:hypothetical protein [Planctomycetaceae bacterium]
MRQFSFVFSGLALVLAAVALTHSLRSGDRSPAPPQLAQLASYYPAPGGPTGVCPAGVCAATAGPPTAYCPAVTCAAASPPEMLESPSEDQPACAIGRCGIDFDSNCCGDCAACEADSVDDNIQALEELLKLQLEAADSPEPRYVALHKAIVKCLDASKLDKATSLLEELAKERSGTPEGDRAAAALAQLKGTALTPPEPPQPAPEND